VPDGPEVPIHVPKLIDTIPGVIIYELESAMPAGVYDNLPQNPDGSVSDPPAIIASIPEIRFKLPRKPVEVNDGLPKIPKEDKKELDDEPKPKGKTEPVSKESPVPLNIIDSIPKLIFDFKGGKTPKEVNDELPKVPDAVPNETPVPFKIIDSIT